MPKKLVVLGTGFASFSCLKKIDKNAYHISVVSPRNHFLFTPLLPSTTVGTIEFRSIIEPIRNLRHLNYYQAYAKELDPINKKITCEEPDTKKIFTVDYDILVIGVGEITNTFNIPGVYEHAYFLKEVTDARKIRTRVIDCFENASLPGLTDEERKRFLRFVVCGGGPTGVEFAAELHDFIQEDVKKKYPELAGLIEIILVEAGVSILNSFDAKLSLYTMKIFKRQNIIVKTGSHIVKITDRHIYLTDSPEFEYGLLVWATGNTASDFIKDCPLPKNKRNKIITDDYLRVKGYDNIYAFGDCIETEGKPRPVTAQVAQQEGKYLGKALSKIAEGKKVKPFVFKDLGMLAYIGSRKALADTPKFKGSGFTTFLFWRSVYLTKLVSLKNKILVLFDWTKNILFGRDVSNF
jgi:NADH:ubiquinone reductase (non-electrogenic)